MTAVMMLQSGQIADAGYDSRWLDNNTLWRRSVGLLILRAQRPLRLTGGPFYIISYETLLAVRYCVVCIMTACSLVGGYQHVALLPAPHIRSPNRWYPPEVHPLFDQRYVIGDVTEGKSCVCLRFPKVYISNYGVTVYVTKMNAMHPRSYS
jgi:hypothetical protein